MGELKECGMVDTAEEREEEEELMVVVCATNCGT